MEHLRSPKEIHPTGHVLHRLPVRPLVVRDVYFYARPRGERAGSFSVLGTPEI